MSRDEVVDGRPEVRPYEHTTHLIAKVGHLLELRIDDAVAEVGLTLRQFSALAVIAHRPGLSATDLARDLLTTPQAVNTLVTRLVTAGLVDKAPSRPRQPLVLTLTDAGFDALHRAEPLATRAEASALADTDPDDLEAIGRALPKLIERLDERRPSRLVHLADDESAGH